MSETAGGGIFLTHTVHTESADHGHIISCKSVTITFTLITYDYIS